VNPRILKKLTQKAEPIVIALGLTQTLERVVSGPVDGDLERTPQVYRKYRWRYRGGEVSQYFNQLPGTIGYGAMSGYYEPEWSDACCWTMLKEYVFDTFTDWDDYSGEDGWPKNTCPRWLIRNPAAILKYARQLAQQPGGTA
jgi:hypothetical protein